MKVLSGSILPLIITGAAFSAMPAQAAEYYNCSNPTGCVPVSSMTPTSDFTKTEYPVVLAHGLTGWSKLFKVIDYWFGIPETLMANGTDVYNTKTSAAHDSEYRGEQLLRQVKTITAISGKDKVNLFGHSHGGHDIRYVASVSPELVASVTSVASPQQGSKMADWAIKMIVEGSKKDGYPEGEFNLGSRAAIGFFNLMGKAVDVGVGIPIEDIQEQDFWRAAVSLTTDYTQNYFNKKYPEALPTEYCGMPAEDNVNGVAYYSFSGADDNAITNPLDPSDYLFASTALTMGEEKNDGLVSSCSSRLGYVIRDDYKMNHADSVNHVFGIVAWSKTKPLEIYRTQANRLKNAGL